MAAVIITFALISALATFFNVAVGRAARRRRALETRGRRASAEITRVGAISGAVVVRTLTVYVRYAVGEGDARKSFEKMIPVTNGLVKPRVGERVNIVYDPEDPKNADVVGNTGLLKVNKAARIAVNGMWLVMAVVVVVEALGLGG